MSWENMTEEERAAWSERMAAARFTAYSSWTGTAAMLRDNPELIDGFRLFCARMHPYSIGNSLRIFGQRQVSRVDARFFWGGYGRRVLPDATPIWILAPKAERTRTKEVVDEKTGKAETVEEAYKIWPVEEVYAAADTVPKDRPCVFCGTEPDQPCDPACAVLQPVAGPIPSREKVAEALEKALRREGGFDELLLDDLDDDPFPEGSWTDGVRWGHVTVTKGTKKRRYSFLHRVDLDSGRVRYAVAGFGVIWIGLDKHSYDEGTAAGLRVQYGDDGGDYRVRDGMEAAPHAPVMNGITIGGQSVVSPSKRRESGRFWLNVWRVGSYMRRAPETTAEQVSQIVRALLDHYLDLPERAAVEAAHARLYAPQRAAIHEGKADKLRGEIEALQARLAAEEAAAKDQAALINGGTK